MRDEPPDFIRKAFPGTWYHPKWKLLCWHPRGVFNEAFADQVINFIEMEERVQDAPFNRYADFSGLTEIRIRFDHVLQVARRRQKVWQPVKTAIYADKPISLSIAQTYAHLMAGGIIEVRAFSARSAVTEFLEVPIRALKPPP